MSIGVQGKDDGSTTPSGANGVGVLGASDKGRGVVGTSKERPGVEGDSDYVGVWGDSTGNAGVLGVSHAKVFAGVAGINDNGDAAGIGVAGTCDKGRGVVGTSKERPGVEGDSDYVGVWGDSTGNAGVLGVSHAKVFAGVAGINDNGDAAGIGVAGTCDKGRGVVGTSKERPGVEGDSDYVGVWGDSTGNAGVLGVSHAKVFAGVAGINDNGDPTGVGLSGSCEKGIGVYGKGGKWAALFDGDVSVTGDVQLAGADFAEDFDAASEGALEPGTVVVIDSSGSLAPGEEAYDTRVAGVVSGANGLRSAVIADRGRPSTSRVPVALMGKVFCKVDASFGAVNIGDLLTTSKTHGHAMAASDPNRRPGALIGKALGAMAEGRGLVPILVSLQ